MSTYVLDQGFPGERARLDAMARFLDPGTLRLVRRLGIGPGDRCLDVGAGTGSIARALSELVGLPGRVVAVDQDARFLDDLPDSVELFRADAQRDDLPTGFDLVHARLLVAHLHPHPEALAHLAASVAPGGWLLVEEVDWTNANLIVPEAPIHTTMIEALQQVMPTFDATYGRRLMADINTLGFIDTFAEFRGTQSPSSPDSWEAWRLLVQQFEPALLRHLTQAELAEWWTLTEDPTHYVTSVTMFAAAARRPR